MQDIAAEMYGLIPKNGSEILGMQVKDLTEEELTIPNKKGNASLVLAIIALAKNLGLKIVAEGIETKSQFEFLKKNGCELGQGYYFAKPMAFDNLLEYLHLNLKRA